MSGGRGPRCAERDRAERGAHPLGRPRYAACAGIRSPRRLRAHTFPDVASARTLRKTTRRLMLTEAALRVIGLVVAISAGVWAALLALGEEAAVGEALHTLGDAPPAAAELRVPPHRALHIARLALLVLRAVATSHGVASPTRTRTEAQVSLGRR